MDELRLSLLQTTLHWHDWQANRAHLQGQMQPLYGQTDVIVLPEMFSSGFTMEVASQAQSLDGEVMQWLREQAEASAAVVCGSVVMATSEGYVNRFIWMPPSGAFSYYDKRHLFRMGNEHQHYQAGQRRVVIEHQGWRIMPLICYDLRFPVWSRNRNDYDLLLVTANWPERRRAHWLALGQARAIENQAYVGLCNRIGEDGNGWQFSGDSCIFAPQGQSLAGLPPHQAGVVQASLSLAELRGYRQEFPAWQDADDFSLQL